MPAPPASEHLSRLKEVSVMALIEDAFGSVLMVKQVNGRRLWALPGGKVKAHESLEHALRREIQEEVGLKVKTFSLLDVYDRPEKATLSVLYRACLEPGAFNPKAKEIAAVAFQSQLPSKSTPSAKHFWIWALRNAC